MKSKLNITGPALALIILLAGCTPNEEPETTTEEATNERTAETTAEETTAVSERTVVEAEEKEIIYAEPAPPPAQYEPIDPAQYAEPAYQSVAPEAPYYQPAEGPCLGACTDAYGRNNADLQREALMEQHAAQSRAANQGKGEGANMCGIAPDATWYGKPC